MAREKSSKNIYGRKKPEFSEFFGILRKYYNTRNLRPFSVSDGIGPNFFIPAAFPTIFGVSVVPIRPVVHAKIGPTASP